MLSLLLIVFALLMYCFIGFAIFAYFFIVRRRKAVRRGAANAFLFYEANGTEVALRWCSCHLCAMIMRSEAVVKWVPVTRQRKRPFPAEIDAAAALLGITRSKKSRSTRAPHKTRHKESAAAAAASSIYTLSSGNDDDSSDSLSLTNEDLERIFADEENAKKAKVRVLQRSMNGFIMVSTCSKCYVKLKLKN